MAHHHRCMRKSLFIVFLSLNINSRVAAVVQTCHTKNQYLQTNVTGRWQQEKVHHHHHHGTKLRRANDSVYTLFNYAKSMPMTWAYNEHMQSLRGRCRTELAALQRRSAQSPTASDAPAKSPCWEIRHVWANNQNAKCWDRWDAQLVLCLRGRTMVVELGAHLKTNLSQFYGQFFVKYLILQIHGDLPPSR